MLEWAIENFGDHNCKMVRVITQKRAVRKTRQALKRSRSYTVGRRVPTGICRRVGAPYASPVLIVWKFVLMTSGKITELTSVPCVFLPVIGCIPPWLLAVCHPWSFWSHSRSLFTAFTWFMRISVLIFSWRIMFSAWFPRFPVFIFAKMIYKGMGGGGHVGWVPGRCSNPGMGGKLSLNIDHRHAFSLMYFPLRKYFPSSPPWSQDSYWLSGERVAQVLRVFGVFCCVGRLHVAFEKGVFIVAVIFVLFSGYSKIKGPKNDRACQINNLPKITHKIDLPGSALSHASPKRPTTNDKVESLPRCCVLRICVTCHCRFIVDSRNSAADNTWW